MCFSPIFEQLCILLRRSGLRVKGGKVMVSFLGCLLNAGCEVSPRVVTLWLELQFIFSIGAPPLPMWADSNTAHPTLMRTMLSNTTELYNCRPTVNVFWENLFLLLHYRKLSNSNVHLEYSLASRCGCMLQSTWRSICCLGKQQRESVGDVFCLL